MKNSGLQSSIILGCHLEHQTVRKHRSWFA